MSNRLITKQKRKLSSSNPRLRLVRKGLSTGELSISVFYYLVDLCRKTLQLIMGCRKVDRISDLPVPILHQILSFLPIKDSVRSSVLSKQWNSVQKSFPILYFILDVPVESAHFEERCRQYLDFVDRSLQVFSQNKLCIDEIKLNLSNIDRKLIPLINTWLPLALHSDVYDLCYTVKLEKDYYSLPETTFVVDSSLLLGSSTFFGLESIRLASVGLSEEVVCDIFRNCPNLTEFELDGIRGFRTLNISKPNKLEDLYMRVPEENCELESISVDALSLDYFHFELHKPCAIDMTSCHNLTELVLWKITITDALYRLLIASFPLLADLCLMYCKFQPVIRISLQRLKNLELNSCSGLEVIEIDAPILSEFKFTSCEEDLPILVSAHVIPILMYLTYDMQSIDGNVDIFWFRVIREDLNVPFKGIHFIPIYSVAKEFDNVSFNIEELFGDEDKDEDEEYEIPPLVEVDCLDLASFEITRSSYWETLLNGLLWSSHPKTIHMKITADSNDEDNCIKSFCRMLMQSECKLCCNLDQCKCWRYRLKSSKLETINGILLDIEKSIGGFSSHLFLLNPDPENPDLEKLELDVMFTLTWDHTEHPE